MKCGVDAGKTKQHKESQGSLVANQVLGISMERAKLCLEFVHLGIVGDGNAAGEAEGEGGAG